MGIPVTNSPYTGKAYLLLIPALSLPADNNEMPT